MKAAGRFLLPVVMAVALGACERRPAGEDRPDFAIGIARPPLDAASLRLVRDSGANSFRRTLEWKTVESPDGTLALPAEFARAIRQARRERLDPLVVLAYGHRRHDNGDFPTSPEALEAFGRFADFAGRELPTVTTWEVWNEWNRGTAMGRRGSPEAYARFVTEVAPALRGARPDAVILGGGMEGVGRADQWTTRAAAAGMLAPLDAVSFHPYTYFLPPEERVPERGLVAFLRELEELLAPFETDGRRRPLYVTEVGWPTHAGPDGVSLDEQAKYTARSLLLLRAEPRVRGVWVYTLFDRDGDATDRENHFGLLFPDGTPKPAWGAFRAVATLLRSVVDAASFAVGDHSLSLTGVWLRHRNGRRSLAVWAIAPNEVWRLRLRAPDPAGPQPVAGALGAGEPLPVRVDRGPNDVTLEVSVTDTPLILTNVPAGLTLESAELR